MLRHVSWCRRLKRFYQRIPQDLRFRRYSSVLEIDVVTSLFICCLLLMFVNICCNGRRIRSHCRDCNTSCIRCFWFCWQSRWILLSRILKDVRCYVVLLRCSLLLGQHRLAHLHSCMNDAWLTQLFLLLIKRFQLVNQDERLHINPDPTAYPINNQTKSKCLRCWLASIAPISLSINYLSDPSSLHQNLSM